MDIYNSVHESLQCHIEKMYFVHNVLPQLVNRVLTCSPVCLNCVHHGFPCLNCAEYCFCGRLGPGFFESKRVIMGDEEDEILFNMLMFVLTSPHPVNHSHRF